MDICTRRRSPKLQAGRPDLPRLSAATFSLSSRTFTLHLQALLSSSTPPQPSHLFIAHICLRYALNPAQALPLRSILALCRIHPARTSPHPSCLPTNNRTFKRATKVRLIHQWLRNYPRAARTRRCPPAHPPRPPSRTPPRSRNDVCA